MKLALVLGLTLIAAPALAAPAPTWVVDKPTSAVRFTGSFNGDAFNGAFRRWDANIQFDPANLAGSSVTAVIETGSAATGDKDRDQALPSADFFAADKFPKATFASRSFTALGAGRYQAAGVLTIRGVRKPLTLPFTLAITGAQAKMTATVALNRLAFGVGQGQWKGTDAIPATVSVNIAISAHKAP
jgi:polyisoprenoid-binding protein YceI